MSESIFSIANRHGREMHIIGIEHAISIIELIGSDDAIKHLKAQVEKEKKELENERPHQI